MWKCFMYCFKCNIKHIHFSFCFYLYNLFLLLHTYLYFKHLQYPCLLTYLHACLNYLYFNVRLPNYLFITYIMWIHLPRWVSIHVNLTSLIICLSIYLLIYKPESPLPYLSTWLFLTTYLPVHLSIYLPKYLFTHLTTCICIHFPTYLSSCPSPWLPVYTWPALN